MKRWQRIVFGALPAIGVGLVLLVAGCYWIYWSVVGFGDLCGNRIVSTEVSPDRARKAVLFERDCGATTGFSSQVSVLSADEDLPNEGGNVFAANGAAGGSDTPWGGPFVALKWRGPQVLALQVESGADIRFSVDRLDDVAIVREVRP